MAVLRRLCFAIAAAVAVAAPAFGSIARGALPTDVPSVQLSVSTNTAQPFHHDTVATVSWSFTSGAPDPDLDWVSVWWTPFAATYIEYANVTTQTGSASFRLLNARSSYEFRFYRGNTSIAVASEKVVPDATFPMGVRAVLQGTSKNQVTIMWMSNRSLGQNTVVKFGLSPDALNTVVPVSDSLTYSAQELNTRLQLPPIAKRTTPFENINKRGLRCVYGQCYNDFTSNELWVDPGLQHVAYLTDLKSSTVYYYQVGEVGGLMSRVRRFRSKTTPGPNSELSLIYVADAGAGYQSGRFSGGASQNALYIYPSIKPDGAQYVWDAIKADPKTASDDLSIMNGDISYARGWPYVWELFHNETEDIFGQLPMLVTYGNHEFDFGHNPFTHAQGGDSGGEAGVATARRFNIENMREPWFYVADGPAFFICLSSEHDPVPQQQWMREVAFAAFDRKVTPWLIVMTHRPMYESNTFAGDIHKMQIALYNDMFIEFGVDLVLTGHSHYYERMCETSNGACNTWGFRDIWTTYPNTVMDTWNCEVWSDKTWLPDCKVACAKLEGCTGVLFGEVQSSGDEPNPDWHHKTEYKCTLLTCPQPYKLTYHEYPNRTLYNMAKAPGRSPAYIVDGTAGGVSVPASTPWFPLTVYKDFLQWGYSRLEMNSTTLTWSHYHISTGQIVDQLVIPSPNP